MERERMVCLTLAALCAVYGIYQMILLLRHRSHTADVQAVVMSVSSALPERVTRNHSKWAQVSYQVDGITYRPLGRLQVPIVVVVGSRVTVHYRLADPGRIAVFSRTRLAASAILAVVLLILGAI